MLEDNYFNNDSKYVDKIAAFCLWGNRQKKALDIHAPNVSKKSYVVGHPRHDFSSLKTPSKRNDSIKNIGFVTRANGLNDYYGRMAVEAFEVLFDDHFQYEYINEKTSKALKSKRNVAEPRNNLIVQSYDTENLLRIMKELNDKDCKLHVRCHPKENLEVWKYLFKKCSIDIEISDSLIPITHWLEAIDVLIGPPSTTFYDAIIEKTRCISITNLDENRHKYIGELWEENNELMKDIPAPSTIDEIVNSALSNKELELNTSIKETLMNEALYPDCRQSLDKFVDICLKFENQNKINLHRNFLLSIYKIASISYQTVWMIKNFLIQRKENSSMYSLSRVTKKYIDGLTK